MKSQQKYILILGLIFFIGLVITYSNHFNNGFHFDDGHTITNNVHITDIKNIPEFFVNPKMFSSRPDHWGLRPIVTSSLAIDYWIAGGLDPFYFHLSTFIWYIVLCVLIFFIFRKLYDLTINHNWTIYFSLVAAALYSLHTVNAETLNYIISRSDVLSTLCIVLSFATYIFYPKLRKWYLYILPAIIGVFAKETMLVLPILLFFYILFFEKELSLKEILQLKNFKISLKVILHLTPLVLSILIFQAYTLSKAGSISGFSNPPLYYMMTQPYVWLHYFLSFFFPFNLSADADWTVFTNPFEDRVIIGFIFIILLGYTIFKTSQKKQTRTISFGLIWFAAALLPTSIAPLAEVMNDHRMFFPFIGLTYSIISGAGILIIKATKKEDTRSSSFMNLIWGSVFIILTAFAYGTYQRNKVWENGETLWYDVTVKSPKNGRGLMNYGLTQMEKGNTKVALEYYEKALVVIPYYSTLHINLGIVKGSIGKISEAEESFKKGILYDPHSDTPYYYYARFLAKKKRFAEAQKIAEKANNITSYNLNTQYLLMDIYYNLELWDPLRKVINHTLKISKNNKTALNYLKFSKKKNSKLDMFIQKTKASPTLKNYLDLSIQYYHDGKYKECINACLEALKIDPNSHLAYNNICSAYNVLGEYEKAIKACESSIGIKPDFALAKNNLKFAKSKIPK